jgi:hypothetical protein
MRNATVASVIAEFRRQAPAVTFELDDTGWPEDFRVDELNLRDEPWPSALEALARVAAGRAGGAAGVRSARAPGLHRKARPRRGERWRRCR